MKNIEIMIGRGYDLHVTRVFNGFRASVVHYRGHNLNSKADSFEEALRTLNDYIEEQGCVRKDRPNGEVTHG